MRLQVKLSELSQKHRPVSVPVSLTIKPLATWLPLEVHVFDRQAAAHLATRSSEVLPGLSSPPNILISEDLYLTSWHSPSNIFTYFDTSMSEDMGREPCKLCWLYTVVCVCFWSIVPQQLYYWTEVHQIYVILIKHTGKWKGYPYYIP